MSDRIDPPADQFEQGPWPSASDPGRLFDHGWPRCVNAVGHPEPNGGYPDSARHIPAHECHSAAAFVDGACRDLDGEPLGVSVYNAAPFVFGQRRDDARPASPQVVLEAWTGDDGPAQRISLTPGEALHLARILMRCADELTFTHRAA